jgi:hypothetical protein
MSWEVVILESVIVSVQLFTALYVIQYLFPSALCESSCIRISNLSSLLIYSFQLQCCHQVLCSVLRTFNDCSSLLQFRNSLNMSVIHTALLNPFLFS